MKAKKDTLFYQEIISLIMQPMCLCVCWGDEITLESSPIKVMGRWQQALVSTANVMLQLKASQSVSHAERWKSCLPLSKLTREGADS